MEKVIKIATVLIIVTLLFLFLFNLSRWLRKKGYFNNNKVVDQEKNNKVNKNIPTKIDDGTSATNRGALSNTEANKLGYFLAISTAVIYSLSQGEFRSFDRLDISRSIGTALGVIVVPAIISAIVSASTKKKNFGFLLGILTIILTIIGSYGNSLR